MDSKDSVTHWVDQIQGGTEAERNLAASNLWNRYGAEILTLARKHLSGRVRQRVAEDDIAQMAFASFCIRLERGDFQLNNRDELWLLLVTITLNKARKSAIAHTRQRRSVHLEQSPGANGHTPGDEDDPVSRLAGDAGALEAFAVGMSEELGRLLAVLGDEQLVAIVGLKLDGYTSEEIAEKYGCVGRTIERKMELIRKKWLQACGTPTDESGGDAR